jgi:hypothetical protein
MTNNANNTWKTDLPYGKNCEVLVGEFIQSHIGGSGLYYSQDENPYFDFAVIKNEREITFEVKAHRSAAKYGNVFFEIRKTIKNGEDSGLSVSTADYWTDYFPDEKKVAVAKLEDVKHFVQASGQYFTDRDNSGNGGRVFGRTIPKELYTGQAFVKVLEVK